MLELDSKDVEQSANLGTGTNGSAQTAAKGNLLRSDKISLVLAVISFLSALSALFVLLTPVLDIVAGFMGLRFAAWSEWQAWVVEGERGLFIAVAFGLIALLFAFLARHRVIHDYSVYVEAGCPQCHENELVRVRRNRKDRALGKIGLPVRRYSCRNCTWHGLRLAGYRYKRNEEGGGPLVADSSGSSPVGDQVEVIGEPVAEGKVGFEAVSEPEIQSLSNDIPFRSENVSANPLEASPGFVEDSTGNNNGYVEEPAVAVQIEEESAYSRHAQESVKDQQVADQLALQTSGRSSDLETDQSEETVSADTGMESEDEDEDDEFARLCQEVAQSKK